MLEIKYLCFLSSKKRKEKTPETYQKYCVLGFVTAVVKKQQCACVFAWMHACVLSLQNRVVQSMKTVIGCELWSQCLDFAPVCFSP